MDHDTTPAPEAQADREEAAFARRLNAEACNNARGLVSQAMGIEAGLDTLTDLFTKFGHEYGTAGRFQRLPYCYLVSDEEITAARAALEQAAGLVANARRVAQLARFQTETTVRDLDAEDGR